MFKIGKLRSFSSGVLATHKAQYINQYSLFNKTRDMISLILGLSGDSR
jgi:hypothetical protein